MTWSLAWRLLNDAIFIVIMFLAGRDSLRLRKENAELRKECEELRKRALEYLAFIQDLRAGVAVQGVAPRRPKGNEWPTN